MFDPENPPPAYEPSQEVFDAKTRQAQERSLQVAQEEEDEWERWNEAQLALALAASLADSQGSSGSTSNHQAATAASASSSSRSPLPRIPPEQQFPVEKQPYKPTPSPSSGISAKEAERFQKDAPAWSGGTSTFEERPSPVTRPQIRVMNVPSSSSSATTSPSEENHGQSHHAAAIAAAIAQGNFDDEFMDEPPPAFSAVAPSLEGPPFEDIAGQMQALRLAPILQNESSGTPNQYARYYYASPDEESFPPETVSAPADLRQFDTPVTERLSPSPSPHHRLSLPASTHNGVRPTHRPTSYSPQTPLVAPPPLQFNPALAYVQKDARQIFRGVTIEEDHASSPSEFYSPALSSVLNGPRKPHPRRPRTAGSGLGSYAPTSYSGPTASPSRSLSLHGSNRSGSPPLQNQPNSFHSFNVSPPPPLRYNAFPSPSVPQPQLQPQFQGGPVFPRPNFESSQNQFHPIPPQGPMPFQQQQQGFPPTPINNNRPPAPPQHWSGAPPFPPTNLQPQFPMTPPRQNIQPQWGVGR